MVLKRSVKLAVWDGASGCGAAKRVADVVVDIVTGGGGERLPMAESEGWIVPVVAAD